MLASPQTSEVLLAIKNFGRAPVSGNVEISFDGKLLDVKPFTLEPGKENRKQLNSSMRKSFTEWAKKNQSVPAPPPAQRNTPFGPPPAPPEAKASGKGG